MCLGEFQITYFKYKWTYELVLALNVKITEGSWDVISGSSWYSYSYHASPHCHSAQT